MEKWRSREFHSAPWAVVGKRAHIWPRWHPLLGGQMAEVTLDVPHADGDTSAARAAQSPARFAQSAIPWGEAGY